MSVANYYIVQNGEAYSAVCHISDVTKILKELDEGVNPETVLGKYMDKFHGDEKEIKKSKQKVHRFNATPVGYAMSVGETRVEVYPIDNGYYVIDYDGRVVINEGEWMGNKDKEWPTGWTIKNAPLIVAY